MAGKLFPEIFIGDSEDTFKKPPTGKDTRLARRDMRIISPLSADEESQQSNSLADSAERKELHEIGEEEEEEEGQLHQDVPGNITEDRCSALATKEISGDDAQQELWTAFASHTEEQLESRMSELGSFSHNFETEGKTTPPFSRPEYPDNSLEDYDSNSFLDEDSILSDSAVSTGYFPCYRTYVELPRYQLPRSTSSPLGDAEGRAGSSCDVSVQCSRCSEGELEVSDMRDSDITHDFSDRGEAPSRGLLCEGDSHRTFGEELEGQKEGESSQQHTALEERRSGPEMSESLKQPGEISIKEAAAELLMQEGALSECAQAAVRKDLGHQLGTDSQSSLLPSKGKAPSPLPSDATTKKCSPKKQQQHCRKDGEDVCLLELTPLLNPKAAVTGQKRGSPCLRGCSPELRHPEIEALGSGKEGRHQTPSPCFCPTTSDNPAGEEPRSTPSRFSLRSLVSWVRKIFRRSSTVQPWASSSWRTEEAKGQVGSKLRWWIHHRRNRIHPHYGSSHPPSKQ